MIKELTDELKNNLYFELETTNLNGETSTFQLQLSVVEIIEKTDNEFRFAEKLNGAFNRDLQRRGQ